MFETVTIVLDWLGVAGAVIFMSLMAVEAPRELALGAGFSVGLLIRAAALYYGWSLPRYRPRQGMPHDASG
jgi:uncharacterized membrane protein YeiH